VSEQELTPIEYFDNPRVRAVIKKYVTFKWVDFDGETGDNLGLSLYNELPDDPWGCEPQILMNIPKRFGLYCRVRDLCGGALRNAQRARKNARSALFRRATNPDPTNPNDQTGLKKITDKAVEAWIETDPEIMRLSMVHDKAELEYTMMCSACEAIKMYYDGLKALLYSGNHEESTFGDLPSPRAKNVRQSEASEETEARSNRMSLESTKHALQGMKKKQRVAEELAEYDL
jgi:hypothetical protein